MLDPTVTSLMTSRSPAVTGQLNPVAVQLVALLPLIAQVIGFAVQTWPISRTVKVSDFDVPGDAVSKQVIDVNV